MNKVLTVIKITKKIIFMHLKLKLYKLHIYLCMSYSIHIVAQNLRINIYMTYKIDINIDKIKITRQLF